MELPFKSCQTTCRLSKFGFIFTVPPEKKWLWLKCETKISWEARNTETMIHSLMIHTPSFKITQQTVNSHDQGFELVLVESEEFKK